MTRLVEALKERPGGTASARFVDVAIVSHRELGGGALDDRLLAGELRNRGLDVAIVAWDGGLFDWSLTTCAVVRSTWNYHQDPQAWSAWVEEVSSSTRLINSPDLLKWNVSKQYLLQLQRAGLPVVPTLLFPAGEEKHLVEAISATGWTDVVMKPAIGAGATGVRRFREGLSSDLGAYAQELGSRGPFLAQSYEPSVETGLERSLVFLGGEFSHALVKPAMDQGGGTASFAAHQPTPGELEIGAAVLRELPSSPLYARIDLAPAAEGARIMEVELTEPDLSLRTSPQALSRLADLLVKHGKE